MKYLKVIFWIIPTIFLFAEMEKACAAADEDPEVRMNRSIRKYEKKYSEYHELRGVLEKTNHWLYAHAAATGNSPSCYGQAMLCQGGPCQIGNQNITAGTVSWKVEILEGDLVAQQDEYKTMIGLRGKLQYARVAQSQTRNWLLQHLQSPIVNGNCSSPLCNPQRLLYLPGQLPCQFQSYSDQYIQQGDVIELIRNRIP